ncbi:glycosyltransferase family 2 protein, partial [Vibrio splendidus]
MIKYSVIIPTYNDTERTVKLVNTIKEIIPKKVDVEIIIADNNPDLQVEFINIDDVRVIHCIEAGSYNARNKAILEAEGDLLIFTDSDCIPDENWISNIDKVVNRCGFDVIAGKTKIFRGNSTELAYLYERNIAFNFDNMKGNKVATTSNLIVKRSLMNNNLFNTISFSGGDVEWTSKYSLNKDI